MLVELKKVAKDHMLIIEISSASRPDKDMHLPNVVCDAIIWNVHLRAIILYTLEIFFFVDYSKKNAELLVFSG